MKFLLLLVLLLSGCRSTSSEAPEISIYSVTVADFSSGKMENNLGGQAGTWEIDSTDSEQRISASLDYRVKRGQEGASLKLEYDVDSPKNAVNGFWMQLRTFDASKYDHFEFWVKGDSDRGYPKTFKIEFKKFREEEKDQTRTIKGSYIVTGVTSQWTKVSIPLNVMNGILDWSDLREFVITFQKRRLDTKEGALYFDDLTFVHTGDAGPSVTDIVQHRKKKTKRDLLPAMLAKILITRLEGFPAEVFVKKDFPESNAGFLREIARDTWGYFDNIVDRENQLPLDNIAFGEKPISNQTYIGDYTNITNVGLYLMCLVSAFDLGFITEKEAARRLNLTLDSIEKMSKYRGFPYNYYDVTIFQETTNFISAVDSGWLAAGIIVAKNAFSGELAEKCAKLLDGMDFSFFYDPVEGHFYHGYYTNINYHSEYHYGAFYTESRAISYLAIGKGDIPKEHWFMLARTFPKTWVWQTQMPLARDLKNCLGYDFYGGYYIYNDKKFVPSWGGSMFEALMPTLIIDEKRLAPDGLGLNDEMHAKIQIEYALGELEYPVFGMSPSTSPDGGYSEYGARPLGIKGYSGSVITPHATFMALEFAPEKCVENLRKMLELYDAYGEYGFYDAIDTETGEVAVKYLCLDQAMSLIALNNYLNDGAIRKRFHADPIAKAAEELLKCEKFFE